MNEIVKAGGALAIRPDQTDWTPQQSAVLQQSGIDNDVTSAELAGFLHLCQRTRLDPFSRQIYLIGRWDNKAGRKVFTPQTGIDGYRVVAHRVIAETRETFGYEDTVWCDASGRWGDVWLAEEPPAAAKVTVLRKGQRFSAVALYREYAQTDRNGNPTRMWRTMGANQIAKCAEALALRKAFPHDLSGVYTAEEMAQADNPAPTPQLHAVNGTPAAEPQFDAAAEGDLSGGRDWINEATEAPDAEAVRAVYREAAQHGASRQQLAEIAVIGQKKATAEPEPVEAEIVEPPAEEEADEATIAEQRLRIAASMAGLADVASEFEKSYGLPIAEAGASQLNEMAALLEGAA